jgi:hypothetical protein
VVVYEGYLGVEPHYELWLHLFKAELFTKKAGERGVRRAVHAGSYTIQVRPGQGELYIPAHLSMSNSRWHDGWFYLRNDKVFLRQEPETGGMIFLDSNHIDSVA